MAALFEDRRDAGRQLADRLRSYRDQDPIVLGLPRGGVPVAYEVAAALEAPLDVLVARKVGAPGRPELGVGAVAPSGVVLLDPEALDALGLSEEDLAPSIRRERDEMDRRLQRYRGGGLPPVRGRTAILVDDGLATGVTATAAIAALRALEPARIVLAVPVCARATAARLADEVAEVVCVGQPEPFRAVGLWYDDFGQTTDAEVLALLEAARNEANARGSDARGSDALSTGAAANAGAASDGAVLPTQTTVEVQAGDVTLQGDLVVPEGVQGVVLFAHGSGSSRFSQRNRAVARRLQEAGLATLLFDLLTEDEEREDLRTRHLRFDIPLLAWRVAGAAQWLAQHDATRRLAIGTFGASTGGGAALLAAAEHSDRIRAVVSRGGRPDLAGDALADVEAPTLLLVGGRDVPVLKLNREALEQMEHAEVELEVIPGATHLFEEPGALDVVADHAAAWFRRHLSDEAPSDGEPSGGQSDASTADGPAHRDAEAPVYRTPPEIARLIAEEAEPFDRIGDADLGALLDRIGDARVVCIGEASHGTEEFYRLRARLTTALLERKGFRIVAAEADWPDAERVDAYVRHRDARETEWEAFARFPTWMWRNAAVRDFAEHLRGWNAERPPADRAGFYGLDLYSLYTSIHEVLRYLEGRDEALADQARERYACFAPFDEDPAQYGRAVVSQGYRACEAEAVAMLQDLLQQRLRLTAGDRRADDRGLFPFFDAAQNARVVRGAEAYYRAMFYGTVSTWNLRDTHMMGTLRSLLTYLGDNSKAVVWAHNSHLGDAEATQMGQRGEINLGHLCRRDFGDGAYLIGQGTHTGTVRAAHDWGAPGRVMDVRPAHPESYEWLCHESGVPRFFLPLRTASDPLRYELGHPRLERAIGVIYRPRTELQSHYFPADLPNQFDEWIWLDETSALTPLDPSRAPELPRVHPFHLLAD